MKVKNNSPVKPLFVFSKISCRPKLRTSHQITFRAPPYLHLPLANALKLPAAFEAQHADQASAPAPAASSNRHRISRTANSPTDAPKRSKERQATNTGPRSYRARPQRTAAARANSSQRNRRPRQTT